MSRWKRKSVVVAAVLLMCLGVVVTRAIWEGRSALGSGDEAAGRGDHGAAIRFWRRAARWYVPGAGHVEGAYDRLRALATRAEEKKDAATALAAWRAIRRSVLATRSLYTPFKDRLEQANEAIARLVAASETGGSADERRTFHLGLLQRQLGPSVPWSLVALLGLAMWIGGGFLFAGRGIGRDDKLRPRAALWSATLVATGLVIWMVGLYKA